MSSQSIFPVSWLVLGFLVLLIIGLVVLFRRRPLQVTRSDAPTRGPAFVGLILCAVVVALELGSITGAGEAEVAGDPISVLAELTPLAAVANEVDRTGPADRMQILFLVTDREGLGRPAALYERIASASNSTDGKLEVQVPELNATCTLTWPFRTTMSGVNVFAETWSWGSLHQSSRLLQQERLSYSIGDARPFQELVLDMETPMDFSLRRTLVQQFHLFGRPLWPDDRLEQGDRDEVALALGRELFGKVRITRLGGEAGAYESEPIRRLLSESNPGGMLLLLAGLGLILFRRVSLMRAAALGLLVVVSLISVSARVSLSSRVSHLQDERPAVRRAAGLHLVQSKAFPVSAAEELLERFQVEPDAEVRAAWLAGSVARGNPMARLEAAREILQLARNDPSEAVQDIVARIDEGRREVREQQEHRSVQRRESAEQDGG